MQFAGRTRCARWPAQRNITLFDLTVNGRVDPSVYIPPVMHVVMAVYLDPQGLVDHAKSATPVT